MSNTIALMGANPPVNALGSFAEGAKTAVGLDGAKIQQDGAKLQQAAATMEMIGAGAMHALGGNINGEVDPQKYKEVLDSFESMGVNVSQFRNNPNFAKVAAQASVSALDRLRLARSDRDYELALQKFELDLMQAAQPKAPNIETIYSEDGREQKVIWDPDKGDFVPIGGQKAPSGTSLSITGADGSVVEFGQGNMPVGKSTANKIDEKALNTAEIGSRISQIANDFKPEYQTLGTRLKNLWSSGKAKVSPDSLSGAERQELDGFAVYKSRAVDNLSQILKEMSGAAVTTQEYERIKTAMPNAGTGLFDGDDPVTFEAKLKRVMEDTDRALARYQFYKMTGIPGSLDNIPLSNVKNINGEWYVKKDDKVFKIGQVEEAQP